VAGGVDHGAAPSFRTSRVSYASERALHRLPRSAARPAALPDLWRTFPEQLALATGRSAVAYDRMGRIAATGPHQG
jgi:hypothetical protein